MARFYILIKKKGSSKWQGAVPTKRGISLTRVRHVVRKSLKPGYSVKIISERKFKSFLLRGASRRGTKLRRRMVRRHIRHRRVRHKRRR